MAAPSTPGALGAFAAVRRTHAAHASALGALERAFGAEMAQLATDRQALQDDRAAMMRQVDEKLARGVAALEEKRAAVERDRAEVDGEKARMRAATPPPDGIVKLNVGGVRFETSRAVLTKVEDSMLGRMFGRCDAMLQSDPDDGSIFIDRDGERFRTILGFLRDLDGSHTQRTIRALAEAAQESMMKELDYFGLEVAVFGARPCTAVSRPWVEGAAFRPGPDMGSRRIECAAVLVGGHVVVFGGHSGGRDLNTTLLLDTQTMAFTPGPNLLTQRRGCAAVQLDADRVLVVGGFDGDHFLNTTEIFHLSRLTVTPGPNMQSVRARCAAVALDARRILVVGGRGGASLSSTEILSLDTMAFTPGPTMIAPRSDCGVVALDEHRIMVAGGISDSEDSEPLSTTEILDVRTTAFTPGPSMSSAREGCAAVSVDAQHVLIIGGANAEFTDLATTEVLDLAANEFLPGPTMLAARSSCAAARLDAADGQPRIIIVIGGCDGRYSWSTTEVLAVEDQGDARAPRRRL